MRGETGDEVGVVGGGFLGTEEGEGDGGGGFGVGEVVDGVGGGGGGGEVGVFGLFGFFVSVDLGAG